MKKKILWAVVVMGAVALFVGAFFLYDYLRDAYEPGGLAVGGPTGVAGTAVILIRLLI